jgi:hypothetical protein
VGVTGLLVASPPHRPDDRRGREVCLPTCCPVCRSEALSGAPSACRHRRYAALPTICADQESRASWDIPSHPAHPRNGQARKGRSASPAKRDNPGKGAAHVRSLCEQLFDHEADTPATTRKPMAQRLHQRRRGTRPRRTTAAPRWRRPGAWPACSPISEVCDVPTPAAA